ncbi:PIG-L family deacetylase [Actinocrispum wychmicini]|uniref:LmbE family N-acetylglucosaminyl deacetylase n=1 Tax=Actinocrispum wychmicini TaxID=1213861 RepID=A0A4R2JK98_9PSEU|nr:PIG-L family deacetylase [Actinocrispum wychmicini]TCO60433.1 LmbE family N-acetylglucosaminyl deacetylase [Actinocrispum wychmicini]
MATLVTFHAHPDDECIACGGVMRKAYEDGHRVVLVVATRGEHGELHGTLDEGEELWERRVKETNAAAEILGASRVEFLGYVDSGMMGDPTNDLPGSFWTADVEEAAQRLAAILTDEDADVLTIYDDYGTYGHPDHIKVHHVGKRAGEIAGTQRVYQHAVNRDLVMAGDAPPEITEDPHFGKPEAMLTAAVDVSAFADHKRKAMRAHASQIDEESFFLAMPDDVFQVAFGTEWFIREGQGPGITETDIMGGLK